MRWALSSRRGKKTDFTKVFRDQDINIYEQLDLARHFGPLHKHATTPIPRIGLEEVHGKTIVDL